MVSRELLLFLAHWRDEVVLTAEGFSQERSQPLIRATAVHFHGRF